MLSVNGSNGRKWRCTFCEALQTKLGHEKHDYDDDAVRAIFEEGQTWAHRRDISVPPGDHAAAYIASRDAKRDLVIPEFMRLFCAEVTGVEYKPYISPPAPERSRDRRAQLPPARLPNRVPTYAARM
jgi:hypothetical protein